MRLPILFFSRKREALVVEGACAYCSATRGFEVGRDVLKVWLLFLPVGGEASNVTATCMACGRAEPHPKRLAIPGVSALFRFGWAFFLVIPLVVIGGGYAVTSAMGKLARANDARSEYTRQQEVAARDRERATVDDAAKAAWKARGDAESACLSAVLAAETSATKDLSKEKPRKPTDANALLAAPYILTSARDVPTGKYFSEFACSIKSGDRDLERGALAYRTLDDARAAIARLGAATKALEPPAVFARVVVECAGTTCTETVGWFDRKAKKVLAVVRVKGPNGANGADREALAKALDDQVAAW